MSLLIKLLKNFYKKKIDKIEMNYLKAWSKNSFE